MNVGVGEFEFKALVAFALVEYTLARPSLAL
jgi:hypothetical protein